MNQLINWPKILTSRTSVCTIFFMLATQDVCDLEVPFEAHLTQAERLIEMSRGISVAQLMFAKEAAEFAATDEYEEWGDATSIDWIRIHCHMTGPQAANYVAA